MATPAATATVMHAGNGGGTAVLRVRRAPLAEAAPPQSGASSSDAPSSAPAPTGARRLAVLLLVFGGEALSAVAAALRRLVGQTLALAARRGAALALLPLHAARAAGSLVAHALSASPVRLVLRALEHLVSLRVEAASGAGPAAEEGARASAHVASRLSLLFGSIRVRTHTSLQLAAPSLRPPPPLLAHTGAGSPAPSAPAAHSGVLQLPWSRHACSGHDSHHHLQQQRAWGQPCVRRPAPAGGGPVPADLGFGPPREEEVRVLCSAELRAEILRFLGDQAARRGGARGGGGGSSLAGPGSSPGPDGGAGGDPGYDVVVLPAPQQQWRWQQQQQQQEPVASAGTLSAASAARVAHNGGGSGGSTPRSLPPAPSRGLTPAQQVGVATALAPVTHTPPHPGSGRYARRPAAANPPLRSDAQQAGGAAASSSSSTGSAASPSGAATNTGSPPAAARCDSPVVDLACPRSVRESRELFEGLSGSARDGAHVPPLPLPPAPAAAREQGPTSSGAAASGGWPLARRSPEPPADGPTQQQQQAWTALHASAAPVGRLSPVAHPAKHGMNPRPGEAVRGAAAAAAAATATSASPAARSSKLPPPPPSLRAAAAAVAVAAASGRSAASPGSPALPSPHGGLLSLLAGGDAEQGGALAMRRPLAGAP